MKEMKRGFVLNEVEGLTSQGQTAYSKYVGNSMEGKPDMTPGNTGPTSPELDNIMKQPDVNVDVKRAITLHQEEEQPGRGIDFDTTGITDPTILQQLNRIKTVTEAGMSPEGVLRQALEDLIKLPATVPDAELKLAIGKVQQELKPFFDKREKEDPKGFWMKLRPKDFIMLRDGRLEDWVNDQYDALYTATQGTRVAESQLLQDAQAAYGEANLYLSKILNQSEKIVDLRNYFETRLNLIVMSSTISTKNIEQAQNAAGRLLATGLLHANSLDGGKVGSMFNRACELLEDMRLRGDRGHLTPEMWEDLRRDLIKQQSELSKRGVGDFVLGGEGKRKYLQSMDAEEREEFEKLTEEEKQKAFDAQVEKNVTRSVNTALDIVISSQRLHIIAARGKELFGNKSFFSDAGGAFRVFNLETFHAYKWQLYNTHDVEMNNLVKQSLIDEWLEGKEGTLEDGSLTHAQAVEARIRLGLREKYKEQLGDNLLKEMSTVNDFFSNGWRIEGMLDQLDNYFAHKIARKDEKEWRDLDDKKKKEYLERGRERASDFGLFFRLRGPRKDLDGEEIDNRGEVWRKIATYRSEEVVRLLRDRISEFDGEIKTVYENVFQGTGIKNYDQFKEEFGSVIRALREKGMKADDPYQIDFASLKPNQEGVYKGLYEELNSATQSTSHPDGRADDIVKIYKQMQDYIGRHYIQTTETNEIDKKTGKTKSKTLVVFEWDPRFADIYNRAFNTDDALLGRLEDVREFNDMKPISKIWASDIGGDVLVRNMNDIAAGQKAVEAYMKFISAHSEEDKLKAAEECAGFYADPNGPPARAKVLRHTYISFLEASKLPEILQSLGIKHLPWRVPATEIQKIYGPQMEGFSVDELLNKRDHIRGLFIANADQARKQAEEAIERINNDPELDAVQKAEKIIKQQSKIQDAEKDAHKQAVALDKILEVTPKDRMRLKAYGLLFSLLAFILAETFEVTGAKELIKAK